jgi:methylase of polypeptide subunit release factors
MLDAFSGSGVISIGAALLGQTAVSFDTSPAAVACAQKNVQRHGLEDKVKVRQGDVRTAVYPGEQFDLVVANPPLIPGDPHNPLEAALFDHSLTATKIFIATLPYILAKRGRCYLATSDVIDRNDYKVDISELCKDASLAERVVNYLHTPYESYRVHRIEHPNWRTRTRPMAQWLINGAPITR